MHKYLQKKLDKDSGSAKSLGGKRMRRMNRRTCIALYLLSFSNLSSGEGSGDIPFTAMPVAVVVVMVPLVGESKADQKNK